jgi:exodeoxyribonuclease VIII
MVDLETMGNNPNSAIIAIGAVAFDLKRREVGPQFYRVVDLESSVKVGLTMDVSTVKWWLGQDDDARQAILKDGDPLPVVLKEFHDWVRTFCFPDDLKLWGNGAAFDNTILSNAYRVCGLRQPWKFWNDRCYRTIKALHPKVSISHSGTQHHALDDAMNQVEHLFEIARSSVTELFPGA